MYKTHNLGRKLSSLLVTHKNAEIAAQKEEPWKEVLSKLYIKTLFLGSIKILQYLQMFFENLHK